MRTKTSETESKEGGAKANAQAQPTHRAQHPLHHLQRTIGNRAVGRLIQTRLRVSQPGDVYEQEADRVAEHVMGMAESAPPFLADGSPVSVQTTCAECSGGGGTCPQCASEEPTVQTLTLTSKIAPSIQRDVNVCELPEAEGVLSQPAEEPNQSVLEEPSQSMEEEEPIQRQQVSLAEEQAPPEESSVQRSPDGHNYASPDISRRIESTKGEGASLPGSVQQEMGGKMGADFSGVRVHTDSKAVQMASELASHAFTHGKDIYFNEGKYKPDTADGKYLLAHELTHTMQQNNEIVQRLAITVQTPLAKGTCGGYSIKWIFALTTPAPSDGYIVQQIDEYKEVLKCPAEGRCLANPTLTFWEAWFVNKGDTHEHLHSSMGFTDQDIQGSAPGKVGYNVGTGLVKFYPKSVTGDLGKDGVAPASPNGGWGPGAAPLSASLPSTTSLPSWWSNAPTEGPKSRMALAAWRCCNNSRDFNVINATP